MKLDARQVAAFLRQPGNVKLAVFYGEDDGLIRERAQSLVKCIAGSLSDPFLVAEITREGWARLPAEMAALSMIGGRRVVVVPDATDAVLAHVSAALKTPGTAMLIVQAPGLPKGKLRSFAETSPESVAIACYAEEGRAVNDLVRTLFAEKGIKADEEAVDWLAQNIGQGRSAIRAEIEKIALFMGDGSLVTLEIAQECLGGQSASAGDDGMVAATLGDMPALDVALDAALADGMTGVGLLRMALAHLQKLHQAKLRMADGASASDVVRFMRPPVFRKTMQAIVATLGLWPADALLRSIEEARRVEIACKQTASRPELLARRFLADLARVAQSLQRRRS